MPATTPASYPPAARRPSPTESARADERFRTATLVAYAGSVSSLDHDRQRLLERLEAVERRLGVHAAADPPAGLTDPDVATGERWQVGQVWAHTAEFVSYWMDQARRVIAARAMSPVPFGRIKSDPERIAAIERDRDDGPVVLMGRVSAALGELSRFLGGLDSADWQARGEHETRGVLTVGEIVEEFIVRHLEEHAEQLDGLSGTGQRGTGQRGTG
ncbi:hypothetical protein BH20CHL6_BH20CHL6_11230 [soil metagenome]